MFFRRYAIRTYRLTPVFLLAAVLWLGLTGLAAPTDVSDTPADLSGIWGFRAGDDLGWAEVNLNPAGWEMIQVPKTWSRQNRSGLGGFAWYRTEVRVSPNMTGRPLAVSFGFGGVGSYEVFAGGRRIGAMGNPSAQNTLFLQPVSFAIPRDAIGADGKLVLAVRMWADPGVCAAFPDSGGFGDYPWLQTRFFQGPFLVGAEGEVRNRVESIYLRLLRTSLPLLAAVVLCGAIGIYHLNLFLRRRELTGYFWFGLLALVFSVNLGFTSPLSDRPFGGVIFTHRLAIATTHAMFVALIQFMWPFLSTPINRWLRAYQASNLLIALFALVAPFHIVILSTPYRFLWLVSFVFIGVGFVTWRAIRGDREARTIWIGIVCLLLASLERFIRQTVKWGDWSPLVSLNLLSGGYVMLAGAMAFSVSNRFSRVHADLEALTESLERKVSERTEELKHKNEELADNLRQLEAARVETERKNHELDKRISELIASRQQADRIFSALSEALPGTVLDGKYRLDEKIGAGGFGAVFRGTNLLTDETVAVKVFKPVPGNETISAVERFKREGISASRLNHPNAITILDSGISREGIAYLVMELLRGRTLAEELKIRGRLTVTRAAGLLLPICSALSEAHRLGIIHRDIKPDNIFINQTPEGEVVKVVDFGIAKLLGEATDNEMDKLTVTGAVVGTPMYIAPERIRGLEYDGKSDVYSVGVMLFQMLTGVTPFRSGGESAVSVLMAHLTKPAPSLRDIRPDIPEAIDEVVLKGLEKNPAERPTAARWKASASSAAVEFNETDIETTADHHATGFVRNQMTEEHSPETGFYVEHDAATLVSSGSFDREDAPTIISDTTIPAKAISEGGKEIDQ
jgi:serine/threonine protein kinase